jgi:oxygen-independent coproporphyrinogen-3 oxidase
MHTNPEQPAGLYIHIPFCVKKCLYCDFYSITDLTQTSSFLAALKREMELAGHCTLSFDTLYIGGGTPSVLDDTAIEQIVATAFNHFNIRSDAEVTIEVNPGTVSLENLRRYRQSGINRLNIGIQSFQEENLKFLGRIHSREEALSSIDWARQAGFENIGLDLIYGLPQQEQNHWLKDLDQAIQINPEHLSCYLLTRESGTPLDREVLADRIRLPAEDHLRKLFETTTDYLTDHGFLHYEVSNFARQADNGGSPWKSRHNRKYWSFAPYIGLGPSAHSYLDPERHWNHRSFEKYLQDIRQGKLPLAEKEKLTHEQRIMEAIYLGFRTAQGIDIGDFQRRFGIDFLTIFRETIADFEKDELVKVTKNHCGLTPKGMALLDSITAEFTSQDLPDDR